MYGRIQPPTIPHWRYNLTTYHVKGVIMTNKIQDTIDNTIMIILFIMSISVTVTFFVTHSQNHAKILERIEQNK